MDEDIISIQLEHQTIETNGIKLHVVQAGPEDGQLILLLHGFPEFWYAWKRQIQFLALGYRVVVPDQRGYNLSEKPGDKSAYNIDELALDVIGLIDAAGHKRATIIGHDWGGMVAWWIAIKYPERLNKLININIPHPQVMKRTLAKSWKQKRKSWYIFFFQIPWLPEFLLSKGNYSVLRRTLTRSSRAGTFSNSDLKQYCKAWSRINALKSMINWYRARRRTGTNKTRKPRIDVPTLLIWGTKDAFLGRKMAQPSIDWCNKGRLVLIEEASHWVHHEEPNRVNSLISGFLNDTIELK